MLLNDYYYQQALLQRQRTPQNVQATPSSRDIVTEYVAGKSMEDEQARQASDDNRIRSMSLRNQAVATGLDRQQNDYFQGQNRVATMVGLGNIGLGLLGTNMATDRMKQADERALEQQRRTQELVAAQQDINKRLSSLFGGVIYKGE
ncbi:MAG: hypothetical protein PHQ43_02405 [Dehalococcoidales bacterium]|nr:hypothetical protein [Dehalococcoidales bacterium]